MFLYSQFLQFLCILLIKINEDRKIWFIHENNVLKNFMVKYYFNLILNAEVFLIYLAEFWNLSWFSFFFLFIPIKFYYFIKHLNFSKYIDNLLMKDYIPLVVDVLYQVNLKDIRNLALIKNLIFWYICKFPKSILEVIKGLSKTYQSQWSFLFDKSDRINPVYISYSLTFLDLKVIFDLLELC